MSNYVDPTILKLYTQWQTFMAIVREEWPTEWNSYDSIYHAYAPYVDPLFSSEDYNNSSVEYRVEVCSLEDDQPLRWLVATLWDQEFSAIDPTSLRVFPRSIAYARDNLRELPRFGLIATDDVIPPHEDTDPADFEDYAYNVTSTVHGTMTLTVGDECCVLSPGTTQLWNAGVTHHAPHSGFWGAIIGSVSTRCIHGV